MGRLLDLSKLSEELGIPEATLLQEAVENWLFDRIAEMDRRIAEIGRQYGTAFPDEIETMIRRGAVDGHPAWEDAIRLEGLLEYRGKLWRQLIHWRRPDDDSH